MPRSPTPRELVAWVPLAVIVGLLVLVYRELGGFTPISPVLESNEGAVGGQLFVPNQKSPILIFGLSLYFFATRLGSLRRTIGAGGALASSLGLLSIGLALEVWSHHTAKLSLGVVSLSLVLLGISGMLGGRAARREMRLPALLLLLVVPIPGVMLNSIVYTLQRFTAEVTGDLLDLVGVDNLVSGDTIYTATAVFQVIEGCSGLRAIETLVMTAIVYQALVPHSRLVSWILVLTAPLFGGLINLGRVLTIVLDPAASPDQDHTTQGLVMLVAGAMLVMGFSYLLERLLPASIDREPGAEVADSEAGRTPDAPTAASGGGESSSPAWPWRRWAFVVALLCVAGIASQGKPWAVERPEHRNPTSLPNELDGWRAQVQQIDKQFLGSTHYTQAISRVYLPEARFEGRSEDRPEEERIGVFVGVDTRRDPLLSGVSPKIHSLGQGWRTLERTPIVLDSAPRVRAYESIQQKLERTEYVVSWQQGTDDWLLEALRDAIGLDRSPWQRPYDATAIRLSTPMRRLSRDEQAAARARIEPLRERVREAFPVPSSDW